MNVEQEIADLFTRIARETGRRISQVNATWMDATRFDSPSTSIVVHSVEVNSKTEADWAKYL